MLGGLLFRLKLDWLSSEKVRMAQLWAHACSSDVASLHNCCELVEVL